MSLEFGPKIRFSPHRNSRKVRELFCSFSKRRYLSLFISCIHKLCFERIIISQTTFDTRPLVTLRATNRLLQATSVSLLTDRNLVREPLPEQFYLREATIETERNTSLHLIRNFTHTTTSSSQHRHHEYRYSHRKKCQVRHCPQQTPKIDSRPCCRHAW